MKKVVVTKNSVFEIFIPSYEEAVKGGSSMESFNKVKAFRAGAGLSQDQMAEALGINKKTYQLKENGNSVWKATEMTKFVEIVNNSTGSNYSVKDIFF